MTILLTNAAAWDTYWLAWLGLLFATFLPPELYAAITGNGHTLSESMWRWEHIYWASPLDLGHWTILHYFIAAGLVWLTLHIGFGLVR